MVDVSAIKLPDGYVFNIEDKEARSEIDSIHQDILEIQTAVGSPLVASSASNMTDQEKIYVYVGDEAGYEYGHWYYYSGSSWEDGGTYNSTAVQTDTTLSISGEPADAKVTGDRISENDSSISSMNPNLTSDCFRWDIGWYITSDGSAYQASGLATTEYIYVSANTTVINNTPDKGVSNKNTVLYISEYDSDSEFTVRTRLMKDQKLITNSSTKYIRISYGYLPSESQDIDLSMLNQYFSITIVTEYAKQHQMVEVKHQLFEYNNYNILSSFPDHNRIVDGVTFIYNASSGEGTITGKATSDNTCSYILPESSRILPFAPGGIYEVLSSGFNSSTLRIKLYRSNDVPISERSVRGNTILSVPDDAAYCSIRLQVGRDVTANDTFKICISNNDGKYLKLKPLEYQVTNLQMPENSMIEGCGNSTTIVSNSSTLHAIKMVNGCKLSNLKFVGQGGDAWIPDGTITSAHGIYVNSAGGSEATRNRIQISGVEIAGFNGGAICIGGTGVNYDDGVSVVNAYLHNNNVGIHIPQKGEYCKFTNVACSRNWIGCVNNGGNNLFSNCGFNGNRTALKMDSTGITDPNDSHGSFMGCNFNSTHAFDSVTSLVAIELIGQTYGQLFSGCTIKSGGISISTSYGIVFGNCNLLDDTNITIVDGGLVLFSGCIFKSRSDSELTVTDNEFVKFDGCYLKDGSVFDPTSTEGLDLIN